MTDEKKSNAEVRHQTEAAGVGRKAQARNGTSLRDQLRGKTPGLKIL